MNIKRITTLIAALASTLMLVASPVAAVSDFNGEHCLQQSVKVTLTPTDATQYEVAGWLCATGTFHGKTVQVLVPGFTYDHTYWDFPYAGNFYSYAHAAHVAGFATFAIDRIGTGQSSHPPADQVTFPHEAYTVKQVVQALRAGQVGGTSFTKVVGVGHSMGAATWILEAAMPNAGVDGLILADYTHVANLPFIIQIGVYRIPVSQDAKWQNAGLPDGYLTSLAGTRGTQFYNQSFSDPVVIAKDEQLKSTGTTGEVATINTARDPSYSNAITVPVLLVVGQKDQLDCNEATAGLSCATSQALHDREASYFPHAASFDAFALPNSGHDTNLHFDSPVFFAKANLWALHNINHVW